MSRYFYPEQINREVSITSLLSSYGYETDVKRLIHCVNPNHTDKSPSMKIFPKDNICYCFSCNERITPINFIMIQENKSFYEACEYLVDTYNLSESCYEKNEKSDNQSFSKDDFPFSVYELKSVGIYGFSKNVELDMGKQEENKHISYGIRDLYKEDKQAFYDMIYYKCLEKSVENDKQYKTCLSLYKEYKKDMEDYLKEDKNQKLIYSYETKDRIFTSEEKNTITTYLLYRGLADDMQKRLHTLKSEKDIINSAIKKAEKYYAFYIENQRQDEFIEKEEEEYEIV